MRLPRNLRSRLALFTGLTLASCLAAYSLSSAYFFWKHTEAELDRRLHEDVELVFRSLTLGAEGVVTWRGGEVPTDVPEEPGGGHWFEVWSPHGKLLLAGGTLGKVPLGGEPDLHYVGKPSRRLELASGAVRVRSEMAEIGGRRLLVRVAISETSSQARLRRLFAELALLTLAVLALGGVGSWVLARRALRPLATMARQARRITAEQLHERLPESGDEDLDRLAGAVNDSLARLEAAFDRLRRFTADASHELRTPLTAIRSVGEVGLRGTHGTAEYRDIVGSMLEEVDRMSRLVVDLLTLARADAGEAHLAPERLDLSALAREVADDLSVLAEERSQRLVVDAPAPVVASADPGSLRQALVNLVDNAVKYAPERSTIRIAAALRAGSPCLEVIDEGPGIAPEHQAHVFERFYRVDKGRSRAMGGTGLGLSIVRGVAEAHRGRVELESAKGKGSTFRIVLPAR